MTIFLNPEEYYSQRNNTFLVDGKNVSWRACMPTSRVMFYKANKINYSNPTDMADDDYFMSLLVSDEAKEFCYSKYPWAYNSLEPEKSIWPNEIHGMYNSWLDEKVTGKRQSDFVTNLDIEMYIDTIVNKGKAIMTSGTFGEILGHAIVFIGYDKQKKEFIIADPYGDFHTKYRNTKGYGVRMTYDEFNTHIKPVDSFQKWGHIII